MKKAAEILVECGYAEQLDFNYQPFFREDNWWVFYEDGSIKVDPFADTLEGRRQADAIEDWLLSEKAGVWVMSDRRVLLAGLSAHQWRLDRIKWCLEHLEKQE